MTGYVRQDTSNNISNGSVINADDLDLEFNAVEVAFNNSTGHSHDGTSGDGAPILVVGPTQDIITSSVQMAPKTTNTYDLGSATNKWKDLYVDGVVYIEELNFGGINTKPTTLLGYSSVSGVAVADFVISTEMAANFESYQIVLSNLTPATDNVGLVFRTSSDGGSTYDTGFADYYYTLNTQAAADVSVVTSSAPIVELTKAWVGSSTGEDGVSGVLTLVGTNSAKRTSITGMLGYSRTDSQYVISEVAGIRNAGSTTNAFRFLFTSGNIESGTIAVYGLRK